MTAKDYAERLRAEGERYHARERPHAEFARTQAETWRQIDAAGLTATVRDLLRKEN